MRGPIGKHERFRIQDLLEAKKTQKEIAELTGRSEAVISRLVNTWRAQA